MALYLGMMSGTSLDGVDVALMDFSGRPQLLAADCTPMPDKIRQNLTALLQNGASSLQKLGELDHQLAQLYAQCVRDFLAKHNLAPDQIRAIGCHGQTVWHAPHGEFPFTMQLGDMNLLAAQTGIDVIGDFRRKDMAVGGQGAPLVPAFHQAVFFDPRYATVVLNIGGISNISVLLPDQPVIGFDTGPGNTLMDQWIALHQKLHYDRNGEWAAQGKVLPALLAQLLDEPFFHLPPPKSTGRELFNLAWLQKKQQQAMQKCGEKSDHFKTSEKMTALSADDVEPFAPQDVQATLLEFTAESIAQALAAIESSLPRRLILCGGGAKNGRLMQRLRETFPHWSLHFSTDLGLDVDYVEAAAFAWLAYRRVQGLPSNLPSVTGAREAVSLGAIFPKL